MLRKDVIVKKYIYHKIRWLCVRFVKLSIILHVQMVGMIGVLNACFELRFDLMILMS